MGHEYGKKTDEGKLLEDAHIFTHPVRHRIVELLAKRPMHIDALSRALDEKRGLVAYHLDTLQEHGFVKSEYGIFLLQELEQIVTALRVYRVTDKVVEVKVKRKRRQNLKARSIRDAITSIGCGTSGFSRFVFIYPTTIPARTILHAITSIGCGTSCFTSNYTRRKDGCHNYCSQKYNQYLFHVLITAYLVLHLHVQNE
ncbi:MAG TPA: ArsR family transcriptional regulator [Methanomicrobia archaeon]|nr:ArsR family transcriptional regulator [Methanomicrobia archaeon]